MYTKQGSAARARERAPYAALRVIQPGADCCAHVPAAAQPDRQDLACLSNVPLAMVYAPRQAFTNLYKPEDWLDRGTIFADLDFPFLGSKGGR